MNDSADEEAAEVVREATVVVGAGILLAAGIACTLIFLVVRTVTGPISRMTEAMGALANDQLNTDIPGLGRDNEIGDMAQAVEVFKTNAIEVKRLNEEQERQKAGAEARQKQAMLQLATDFEQKLGGVIESLTQSSEGMQRTARDMKSVAEEMVTSSSSVANSSTEASENASSVASAMEEMVVSSKEIAAQMARAQEKSTQTRSSAENASETVDRLNVRVANIGEVVVAIQDIAGQTNLLALNATIEAARAGEAGKGFAVVADEVKKLANETAEKTSEISGRIQEVQGATSEAVEAMKLIIRNIAEIDQAVMTVSAAIEEQSATSDEVNRNVTQSAQAAQEVTKVIVSVRNQAQNNGESSDTVLEAAQALSRLSRSINVSVSEFLDTIRKDNRNDRDAAVDKGGSDLSNVHSIAAE